MPYLSISDLNYKNDLIVMYTSNSDLSNMKEILQLNQMIGEISLEDLAKPCSTASPIGFSPVMPMQVHTLYCHYFVYNHDIWLQCYCSTNINLYQKIS